MSPESTRLFGYLKKQGSVSVREAMLDLNIGSPSKAIRRLRESGVTIETRTRKNPVTGQSYARYYLA